MPANPTPLYAPPRAARLPQVRFVDTSNLALVQAALSDRTRMVHMESPSNPLMRITDIRGLARLLAGRDILLSIDSTMMSPM